MGRKRSRKNNHLPTGMQRKGKSYYLVRWDGTRNIWKPLGPDLKAALIEYNMQARTGFSVGTKFSDLVAQCLPDVFDKLKPRTRQNYARAMNNLLDAFGTAPVKEITPVHVARYMDARSSIHGANTEKAVLSKVLELGIRRGWCTENVARKIDYHPKVRRRRIIAPGEWRKIRLASTSDLIPVFMDLAYITGLRVGDVLAMRWKQVREDGLYVLQGKNQVEAVYEVTEALGGVLERAKRLHGRSGKVKTLLQPETAVIHTRALKPYTYYGFRSIWRTTISRAGLEDIHIHDIRRTAITAAKAAGRRPAEFSQHRTESEAEAYVVEVPRVRPLELIK